MIIWLGDGELSVTRGDYNNMVHYLFMGLILYGMVVISRKLHDTRRRLDTSDVDVTIDFSVALARVCMCVWFYDVCFTSILTLWYQ